MYVKTTLNMDVLRQVLLMILKKKAFVEKPVYIFISFHK